MTGVFEGMYAAHYDALYFDKDYASEADRLEAVLGRSSSDGRLTVLDLGCGTGGHSIELARRGHQIVGVDISPAMLAIARTRATDAGVDAVRFVEDDIRTYRGRSTFDAVVMMFAVIGYQISNEDVLQSLQTARQHLKDGGILAFDAWYGPAVLTVRPSDREKRSLLPDGSELVRRASSQLDPFTHTCRVTYDLRRVSKGEAVEDTQETHRVRYFFPEELKLFLQVAGFDDVSLTSFTRPGQAPDDSDWNVFVTATNRL